MEQEKQRKAYEEKREIEEKEWKEAQEKRNEASSKLIGFVTDSLPVYINFEYQKKLLSYHATFSTSDMFREIDANKNGFINAAELSEYFKDEEDFQEFNFEIVTKKLEWSWRGQVVIPRFQRRTFSMLQQPKRLLWLKLSELPSKSEE